MLLISQSLWNLVLILVLFPGFPGAQATNPWNATNSYSYAETWNTSTLSSYVDDVRASKRGYQTEEPQSESWTVMVAAMDEGTDMMLLEDVRNTAGASLNSTDHYDEGSARTDIWSWLPYRWRWTVVASLVAGIVGIVGNLLVIIVLYQRRENSRSTDTLIGALAVADFMTSVGLIPLPPLNTVPTTRLGEFYCKVIWQPLYVRLWAYMSAFVLTAISVERYIAVAHPLYFRRILTRRRVIMVVVSLWFCALVMCMAAFKHAHINKFNNQCVFTPLSFKTGLAFNIYYTVIQLLLPTMIMVITQILIAIRLNRQAERFKNSASIHMKAKKAVIKMMLIIIVIYIVCWTPIRVYAILFKVFSVSSAYRRAFNLVAFVNSCVNPIIYSARYEEFRSAVKDLFVGGKVRQRALFDHDQDTEPNPSV